MPPGIPYIIGNEAAERFSFYGMRAILVIFMTQFLRGHDGLAPMTEPQAKFWYHTFNWAVYFTPVFGALIADAWLGKYRTILALSRSTAWVISHWRSMTRGWDWRSACA